jgi:hypothetical protein
MIEQNYSTNAEQPLFSVPLLESYDDAGFGLVPIARGSKAPASKGWNKEENCRITIDSDARGWNGNLGIAHVYSRTMALDIDNLDKARKWFAARSIDLDALLNAPDAVQIVSGKENRAKLLYRLPNGVEPLPSKKVKSEGHDTIDFRCATATGSTVQDVLPPSIHPDTGKPYQWGGAGDFRDLPELPAELLQLWRESLAGKSTGDASSLFADATENTGTVAQTGVDATTKALMGGDYNGPPAARKKVESALECVTPNTGYEPWCEILRGLHDWDSEQGREIGREWSKKGDNYCGDAEFDQKWDSFNE